MSDRMLTMRLGSKTFDFPRHVAVMAIVNRTPDSFYDRGSTYGLSDAVERGLTAVDEGADIIDVGGVKAGPGDVVSAEDELDRVVPVIEALRARTDAVLSVDTFRASVARIALDAGADIVNDVSGLSEPELADVVAGHSHAALVVMHTGGPPRTRPFRATYHPDVTTAVVDGCRRLVTQAMARGVPEARIIVDPGHDFGKNTWHSLELTRRLPALTALGYPVLVAASNKDFLGETLDVPLDQRVEASLAAAAVSVMLGASILRVHETLETVRVVRTVEVILGRRPPAIAVRGLD